MGMDLKKAAQFDRAGVSTQYRAARTFKSRIRGALASVLLNFWIELP
jgi:hypothetical protein